jgi:sulfite reductase (ferredoxin)
MVFEAQLMLDTGDVQRAGRDAYAAMLRAAKALVQVQYDDVTDDADEIVEEFKERFVETELFFDPFAGPKFANYLLGAHESAGTAFTRDTATMRIEEAQLVIEAVHSTYNKLRSQPATPA